MGSLEQFIEDTNSAHNAEEVFKAYAHSLNEFGYDRICYSLLTDHPSLDLKSGHGVLRNYSEDWMNHYVTSGYVGVDPVPLYCFQTNKPFKWDWLTKNIALPTKALKIMTEAREALLLDGVAIPMHGVNGELAGVGMASSSGGTDVDKNAMSKIRALSFQFHLAFTEKETDGEKIKNVYLTPREKEILSWAAEGKSDQVISDIVGLSYSTVRFHMNNIFAKLNANERTLAVVKAIRHGLIQPGKVDQS